MIQSVIKLAQKSFPKGGTILEFGVGSGGSYIQLASRIVKGWPCKLIGFDSFQGLPKEAEGVWYPERHREGNYSYSKSLVEDRLKKLGVTFPDDKRFYLVEGWFKDTLTKIRLQSIENVILVNIDIDVYSSTKLVLKFIKSLLQPGTLVYFDDWKDPIDKYKGKWGEHLAFEQWIATNPRIDYTLSPVSTGQQLMKVKGIR